MTTPAVAGRKVLIERVRDEHARALAVFFQEAWGRDPSSGEVRLDPDRPSWLCLEDGRVIGYLGSFSARMRSGGQEYSGHWLKGFWVLPEYRSGPVGYTLLRQAVKELGPIWASLVALPARRLMAACGLAERSLLFNRLLILRPARFLGTLDPARVGLMTLPAWVERGWRVFRRTPLVSVAGAAAVLALRGRALPGRIRARGLSAAVGWDVPAAALDQLWETLRDQVPTCTVRDAATLGTRYRASGCYDLIAVRDPEARVLGWAVLRHVNESTDPRLGGLRIGSLSDIIFPLDRPEVGIAAITGAAALARRNGADALLCSGTHPVLDRVLAQSAFVSLPGNLRIMARETGIAEYGTVSGEMWFTRGDGESDGAF